ncbi:WYL domain-containing protein [Pseudomonas jilinensis]|uniref:WYL domain-containing protein n=2 Tax=Pseudomonas jilinensis TaxID=2078689 RepID=A0A396S3L5_9PSED|nr:WYL domain-containing protein [Pseudomonas jilinensis]RHW21293.1 WYL domain-containing protein [Pseudomonas jilinensis]
MLDTRDTLLRLFALLRLIPQQPKFIASTTLQEKLTEQGFDVDLRTVQRDLNRLSIPFALISHKEPSGRYQWSLTQNAPLDLRSMEPSTALALVLAESHLKNLLPQAVLDLLTPQFNKARGYLDNNGQNGLAHWAQRVRAHPNGKALLPAPVQPHAWAQVSTALLERKQLRINYLSRSKAEQKQLLIHPAGLISRHSISYLLGTVDGYSDTRQFALHRIQQAECLETSAQHEQPLDIDDYLNGGGFNSSGPVEQVELIADVSPQIAWLLNETPLSPNQTLEPLPDTDWRRLKAMVPDDQETLWWVFGLGENVRVWGPDSWMQAIREKIARLEKLYAR